MPTIAKPPPEHDVAKLVLGLFAWLRDKRLTTATVPARASLAHIPGFPKSAQGFVHIAGREISLSLLD